MHAKKLLPPTFYSRIDACVVVRRVRSYWGHGMPVLGTPVLRSLAMGTYGLSYGEARTARCPLARRARWLAGRARASSQFQNSGSCMHDLI